MLRSKTVIVCMIGFLLCGCATIFKGSSADVRVNSAPAGATVTVDDINRGTTPQTLSLKRNRDYTLEFTRDGYETVRMEVTKKFDLMTAIVGNLVSFQLLGIIVDVATGSAYSLTPADVQANMSTIAQHLPEGYAPQEDEIYVVMFTTEEWKALQSK